MIDFADKLGIIKDYISAFKACVHVHLDMFVDIYESNNEL